MMMLTPEEPLSIELTEKYINKFRWHRVVAKKKHNRY